MAGLVQELDAAITRLGTSPEARLGVESMAAQPAGSAASAAPAAGAGG
jgi:hypothetical protein